MGLASLPALAQDMIVERAIFEDPSGTLNLAQVEQAEFSLTGKIINRGYTRAALWVRLRVDAPPEATLLGLRVFPTQLDDVSVFSPLLPDEGQSVTGRTT